MNLSIRQLRTLLRVAERGSFTAASEELFVTVPALIQQMNTLEHELGFAVFVRSNKGVRLTSEGEELVEVAKPMIDELERTVERLRNQAAQKGTIRLGVVGWDTQLAVHGLVLDLYRHAHPDTSLEYEETPRQALLEECLAGRLDVGFCNDEGAARNVGLEFACLSVSNASAFLSGDNPLCSRDTVRREDLAGMTVLVDAGRTSEPVWQWLGQGDDIRVETLDVGVEDVIRRRSRDCVVLLPSRFAEMFKSMENRPLVPPINYVSGLAYRSDAPARVREFVDFMVRESRG